MLFGYDENTHEMVTVSFAANFGVPVPFYTEFGAAGDRHATGDSAGLICRNDACDAVHWTVEVMEDAEGLAVVLGAAGHRLRIDARDPVVYDNVLYAGGGCIAAGGGRVRSALYELAGVEVESQMARYKDISATMAGIHFGQPLVGCLSTWKGLYGQMWSQDRSDQGSSDGAWRWRHEGPTVRTSADVSTQVLD